MARQKTTGTKPEVDLGDALEWLGLDHAVNEPILPGSRIRVDVVLRERRIAVLIHGCYWHRCSKHKSLPRTNAEFWAAKLAANVARDRLTKRLLVVAGWHVIVAWEHDDMVRIARRISRMTALVS